MDSRVIKWMGIPYRQKMDLYPLVTISKDPILYGNGVINMEMKLLMLIVEGYIVVVSFNILLLKKAEAVLRML